MSSAIQTVHSYWAYLTLLVLLLAVLNASYGFFTNKEYKLSKDLRINLYALIFSHIQFLIGLVLYFTADRFGLWSDLGMGDVMKNDIARHYLVEHPITNILAIVIITIGWSKHKKEESSKRKYGKIAFFYTLGLLLILSRIPWEEWLGI